MHLRKLINIFYKKYPKKPTTIFASLNFVLPIARPKVPKEQPKQKHGHLNKRANKKSKN